MTEPRSRSRTDTAVTGMRFTRVMAPAPATSTSSGVTLSLTLPFDAESLLDFLGRRAVPGIERVDGSRYSRTVRLPSGPAAMSLEVTPERVEGRFWAAHPRDLAQCLQCARDLLDLDADPAVIDGHLAASPPLARSVADHPGLRVPGHVDGFEVAVRAIVGQQISVSGARAILGRLVATYGDPIAAPFGLTKLFPSAQRLAGVDVGDLPMPRSRGRALATMAEAVDSKDFALDRTADPAIVRRHLLALPGIGPWTADYIALRALGDPDVFLATDLGVRQGLTRIGLADRPSAVVESWSPWRSYAMMHVWKSLEGQTR
ncbi:MAG: DNA-3-methyladenine glycosylase family protein [Nocardioidaceae bacterium]